MVFTCVERVSIYSSSIEIGFLLLNFSLKSDPSVGVDHEMFKVVGEAHSESVYGNVPKSGSTKASEHVPINRARGTSREWTSH